MDKTGSPAAKAADAADVLELLVAKLEVSHGGRFEQLPTVIIMVVQQLLDDAGGDGKATLLQTLGNLQVAEVGGAELLPFGMACGVGLQRLVEGFVEMREGIYLPFWSAPFLRQRSGGTSGRFSSSRSPCWMVLRSMSSRLTR
jgi:hypothetical protein